MGINDKPRFQLTSEDDRNRLRLYLEGRVRVLAGEKKRVSEDIDAGFVDGAEMEIMCIYDELLGEQMPDPKTLQKKRLGRGKIAKCAS